MSAVGLVQGQPGRDLGRNADAGGRADDDRADARDPAGQRDHPHGPDRRRLRPPSLQRPSRRGRGDLEERPARRCSSDGRARTTWRTTCSARPDSTYLKGGVDASGKLVAWRNHFMNFSADPPGREGGQRPTSSSGMGATEFPARFVPNYALYTSFIHFNVPTGAMRAPGSNAIAFVMQSFIDELAHAAGKDPLQFRLDLLCGCRSSSRRLRRPIRNAAPGGGRGGGGGQQGGWDPARMRGVLELVRDKSGWGTRKLRAGHRDGRRVPLQPPGLLRGSGRSHRGRAEARQSEQGVGGRRHRPPDHQPAQGRSAGAGLRHRRAEPPHGASRSRSPTGA